MRSLSRNIGWLTQQGQDQLRHNDGDSWLGGWADCIYYALSIGIGKFHCQISILRSGKFQSSAGATERLKSFKLEVILGKRSTSSRAEIQIAEGVTTKTG